MAIEQGKSGAVMVTGEHIAVAQMMAAKGAIKLEKLGMKSRGGSMRKAWAQKLGMKPTAKHDTVIAELQRRIDAALAPPKVRPIMAIASEICTHWPRPYFGAVPYLEAMFSLRTVQDMYGLDTGESIVQYFLANATTWRGEHAKRLKAELAALVKH